MSTTYQFKDEIKTPVQTPSITYQFEDAPPTPPSATGMDLTTAPEWAGRHPNIYGIAGAAREKLGPVVEGIGLIGGGMAGAAPGVLSGFPLMAASSVLGAGLGYGIGKGITHGADVLLGNTPPEKITQSVKRTAIDVKTGAMTEMVGQSAGVATDFILKKLTPFARKLYESAIKPIPSMPIKTREKIITTGLDNAVKGLPYRPNEKSVMQLGKNITNLVDTADSIVTSGAKIGDTIKTEPLLKALDEVLNSFSEGPFPQKDIAIINSLKKQLIDRGETMPVDEALKMKKFIYKVADKYYKPGLTAIIPAKVEAEKAVARAIKQELETLFPAITPINKEASRQIEFGKVLERAASRVGNRELFSIFDFLGGGVGGIAAGTTGIPEGIAASKIATSPHFKSFVAKQIMKANIPYTVKREILNQITRYGIVKYMENRNPSQNIQNIPDEHLLSIANEQPVEPSPQNTGKISTPIPSQSLFEGKDPLGLGF